MEPGNIIEYIDQGKIICAVILEKKQRLRVLTETNREAKLSPCRILHKCSSRFDTSMGRDNLVKLMRNFVDKRNDLKKNVDIKDLWNVLNTEKEWIDLETITGLCFPGQGGSDHKSAVIRAFFENRIYFKFDNQNFFPNSVKHVEGAIAREKEQARKAEIIETCGSLIKNFLKYENPAALQQLLEFKEILKSLYLFEKDSKYFELGKGILEKAALRNIDGFFQVLVKMGVFEPDENIDLLKFDVPKNFKDKVIEDCLELFKKDIPKQNREDLTHLDLMTIDGKLTLDYDDAISIENLGDYYSVGVHIIDVGSFVKKGDSIDRAAKERVSSIYMPDLKISMLPETLSEGLCSLKEGMIKPAISTLIKISPYGEILENRITASLIRVKKQLTYFDVNQMIEEKHDKNLIKLLEISKKYRQTRLDAGAVHISLPEIYVRIEEDGEIIVNNIDRESPGRLIVSELMIMANWFMALFLSKKNIPAIFRSQPGPREKLYHGEVETIFQNIMQRKHLSRFILNSEQEHHCGLGLDAYVTATSPIRKYFDLVTQRQIRAGLGLEQAYTKEEIDNIILSLEQSLSNVSAIQRNRTRYWLLKYLENKKGDKEEAMVLYKKRNSYQILITKYMIEIDLPSCGVELKPGGIIMVTIQHVDARKNVLSVFMG